MKGKWVMIMRHGPERGDPNSDFRAHMPLYKKMLVAQDMGAIGVVFVSQIEDEDLYPLEYVPGYSNEGIPPFTFQTKQQIDC